MNTAELNAILYYADFLSIQYTGTPVTDTCKYFFMRGTPINISYLAGVEPFYNAENQYFKQSLTEYNLIKNKCGDDIVEGFIDGICNLAACGMVDGERMLQVAYRWSPKKRREAAQNKFYEWKNNVFYEHITQDEHGKSIVTKCSRNIAHYEKSQGLRVGCSIDPSSRITAEELLVSDFSKEEKDLYEQAQKWATLIAENIENDGKRD